MLPCADGGAQPYDLVVIVAHKGSTAGGGHYTSRVAAFVADGVTIVGWALANDHCVTRCDASNVTHSTSLDQPYVYFFRHRGGLAAGAVGAVGEPPALPTAAAAAEAASAAIAAPAPAAAARAAPMTRGQAMSVVPSSASPAFPTPLTATELSEVGGAFAAPGDGRWDGGA